MEGTAITPAIQTPQNAIRSHNNQYTAPPNGALSRKSTTRSSTLLRYLPSSDCFSFVVLVSAFSLSGRFLALFPLNAPASLLGLRCNIAGTESLAPALGIDGVS